jgi:methylase of polypeptide subunit release factors
VPSKRLSVAHSIIGVSKGRPASDFYRTPAFVTEALLVQEAFTGTVWEPACGDGAMSRVLEQKLPHCRIISTDLNDYGYGQPGVDFLKTRLKADAIVTNPPFRLATEFAEHALECAPKVALFLKLAFLEGTRRYCLFRKFPPKFVHVFSRRVSLTRNGMKETPNGGMMAFAWFVWEKDYQGRPQVDWISPDNDEELESHGLPSPR